MDYPLMSYDERVRLQEEFIRKSQLYARALTEENCTPYLARGNPAETYAVLAQIYATLASSLRRP